MEITSLREKRRWQAAIACLALIYSSLYIARPIAEFLRERNLLRAAVGLVFLLAAISVVLAIRRSRAGWRVYLGVAGAALLYVPVLILLRLPEERLHLVQYGLFCGLVFAALQERRTHRPLPPDATAVERITRAPWLQSLVLTLVAGWIDEGIQGILPNRYYDLRDVALNLSAGVLYLLGWCVLEATRSWESHVAVAQDDEQRGNPGG